MVKRRNITLLPPVHQTDELKRFFNATVDQLFQPGKTDIVSGYIGRKPSYFDAARDFYKSEPTPARTERQLEPAVISVDEVGNVNRIVFYDDFVNHLRSAGAPVNDMARLLACRRYSWAPPIDLDKLLNFHNYYWVEESAAATLVKPKSVTYTATANQMTFALPAVIGALNGRPSKITVKINGSSYTTFTVAGSSVVLSSAPATGATVIVSRYSDILDTLTGMEHPVNPLTGNALSSGQRLHIVDSERDGVYWIEGVGRTTAFVNDIEDYTGDRPYVVIDRACKSRNVWSRRNRWVHRSTLPDAALISENQASRPIVEFQGNMVLFNYGTFRVDDITCTATTNPVKLATLDIDEHEISVADINGLPLGSVTVDDDHVLAPGDRLLARQTVPNWTPKTNFAIGDIVYQLGDTYRCVTAHVSGTAFSSTNWVDDPFATINNQIFEIEEVEDGMSSVYGLLLQTDTSLGAVTRLADSNIEYWFDGNGWPEAQPFDAFPLFDLFDNNGVSFADTTVYPANTFAGCKLFSFAIGNGAEDLFVPQALKYNEYGQIVFENNVETQQLTSDGDTLDVARFYAFDEDGEKVYENSWHIFEDDIQLFDGPTPINLQANPDNQTPLTISRNQWFDHFSQTLSNQVGFTGEPYSINNWRDTARDLGTGKSILQHDAPLTRTMALVSDDGFNIIDAILFARSEYDTYLGKFIRRYQDLIDSSAVSAQASTSSIVDSVLTSLVVTKQSDYAFSLSRMAGDQYFIPPTPSYLGLLPVFQPKMVSQDGNSFIQGHDGSLRAAYGDQRDAVLLEFETRVYNSIDAAFKTESSGFSISEFVGGYFGTSLDSQFSRDEFLSILARRFEAWTQAREIDYRAHEDFSPEDRFTWNYSSIIDAHGRPFDGHWRGIYRHHFGTDRPHLAPWEMLGFGDRPSWWVSEYGPAPYTSGNQQMWEDIASGLIRHGPRAGISLYHIRSGLLPTYTGSVMTYPGKLPVDESGALLDPIAAYVVPSQPGALFAAKDWKFGDGADVETTWLRSSNYRFAVCLALYLMRPASFVERGWDTFDDIIGPNGQPISRKTGKRPQLADIVVHGERLDGAQVSNFGIQQWLSDYIISQGRSPADLGDSLRTSQVNLAHRVAGFTTRDNMRVAADNFGLVPDDDIQVVLHEGHSFTEEFYSGVIVEWSGQGYRVFGFDPSRSSFSVFRADENAGKSKLFADESQARAINPWRANTYYSLGTLVSYDGGVHACIRPHTSSTKFETAFWQVKSDTALPDTSDLFIPRIGTAVVEIPYGTEFLSRQEVVNFLIGHGKYMESRGWLFEESEDEGTTNWTASARSFANWSKFTWDAGYFIALSPSARKVTFHSELGTILNVEQTLNGFYGIYDRRGEAIPREISSVNRDEGSTLFLSAGDSDIFGARVRVADIEHALVFSNKTIFDDTIYEPLYNLRQPRLKLDILRASEWKGRYEAPGYVIINGEIKPSLDKNAENLRTAFDIENADDPILRDYARHLIGFQKRDYLTALNLSDTQQFEFYQGLIQNKGTVGAFDRLLRSNIIGENRQLAFREEWAVKVGDYGAANPFERWEVEVRRSDIINQNQLFYFDSMLSRDDWTNLQTDNGRWVSTPEGKEPSDFVFSTTTAENSEALPNAGYARLSDVQFITRTYDEMVTAITDYVEAGNTLRANMLAWILDDTVGEWMIFKLRHLSVNGQINRVVEVFSDDSDEDNIVTVVQMANPTSLTTDDVGRYVVPLLPIDTISAIEGMVKITSVDEDEGTFTVDFDIFQGKEYSGTGSDIGPGLCILEPVRFASLVERADVPAAYWNDGDLAFVDDTGTGNWGVYQYASSAFTLIRRQGPRVENEKFQSSLLFNLDTKITSKRLSPEPLVLDHITLLDYATGNIAGAADRDIAFKLEYDPAIYDGDSDWGDGEVGKLWWDLSTTRYVNPYTDDLARPGITEAEIVTELEYRAQYWTAVAPGASVDVYEWVRSEIKPEDWVELSEQNPTGPYAGQVLGGIDGKFVTKEVFSRRYNAMRTYYYFWVKNRLTKPNVPFRYLSGFGVAQLLADPSTSGLVWIAPISKHGLLFSNVGESLERNHTVLQIDFAAHPYDGPVHQQWALIRIGDEDSQPPIAVWSKMVDSLIGFDHNLKVLPDPALHPSAATGVRTMPRQNVFAPRDGVTRKGIMDARQSCIEMINYILSRHDYSSDKADKINDLFVESSLSQRLAWSQPDGSQYIEPLPPSSEYDVIVYSIEERDAFLTDHLYSRFLAPFPWDKIGWEEGPWDADFSVSPRVLLSGLNSARPFWSVWEIDLASIPDNASKEELEALVIDLFIPVKTYDHEVTSIAARDALPDVESGDRVLVRDTSTNDFWTIWAYFENASESHAAGYSLVNAQRYRTADFLARADWYAEGYDSSLPPVVRYATVLDRNNTEKDDPTSIFVRIDNDGAGRWIWTAYDRDTATWNIVARQNGTIQLSENFFDIARDIYGWNGVDDTVFDASKIAKRDGSFELRYLLRSLTDSGLLSNLEINELFFSLIHFVHSQQDQVDWLLPTSYMSVVGYNEPLRASAIAIPDNIDTILKYVDEVKPYRVKTREFVRGLINDDDVINVRGSDFDKPVYFDTNLGRYRRLDLTIDADILATLPWSDWSEDPESDRVRNITPTITYDRVWPTLSEGANSGAAKFIDDYYDPSETMPEKNLSTLLKLDFKGTIIDGRRSVDGEANDTDVKIVGVKAADADISINGVSDLKFNFGFQDAALSANKPEELVIVKADDGLVLTIEQNWGAGVPRQRLIGMDVASLSGTTIETRFDYIPQNSANVFAFQDGVRVAASNLTFNQLLGSVNVPLTKPDSNHANRIAVRTIGFGASTNILSQKFVVSTGSATYSMSIPTGANVFLAVDGVQSDNVIASHTTTTVTLSPAPTAGKKLVFTIIASNGGRLTAHTDEFSYTPSKTWTAPAHATVNPQRHSTSIVEKNGLRLTPPYTYYGSFGEFNRFVELTDSPDLTTSVNVYLNGVLDNTQTTLTNGMIVPNSPSLMVADVRVIVRVEEDFDLVGTALSLRDDMVSGDKILVTSFDYDNLFDVRTHVRHGRADGTYLIAAPVNQNYTWITVNGALALEGFDYVVEPVIDAYDTLPKDFTYFDSIDSRRKFRFFASHVDTDRIVFTTFNTDVASPPSTRQLSTKTRSTERHIDNRLNAAAWELNFLNYEQRGGTLVNRVDNDSSEIVIQANPNNLPSEMVASDPFAIPDEYRQQPGVIWINGERIEYYSLSKSGSVYTLAQLRRRTHQTHAAEFYAIGTQVASENVVSSNFDRMI